MFKTTRSFVDVKHSTRLHCVSLINISASLCLRCLTLHAGADWAVSPLPHDAVLLLGQHVLRPPVEVAHLPVLYEVVLGRVLVSVIDGLADVGRALLEVNQGLGGDLGK